MADSSGTRAPSAARSIAYEPAGKPGVAEVSSAVPDDMHGHGIASLLLEHLVW